MTRSRPSANGIAKRTGKLMPSFKQGDIIRVPLSLYRSIDAAAPAGARRLQRRNRRRERYQR